MSIVELIKAGRLDPILKTDRHGIVLHVGWRRKAGSRKQGEWNLTRPRAWLDRSSGALTPGAQLVTSERRRQISDEGYDAAHDDGHSAGELAVAARCYATPPDQRNQLAACESGMQLPDAWPWEARWWKPGPDRIRELSKAGALYLAESARLRRADDIAGAQKNEYLALDCVRAIDDLYEVGPSSPSPELLEIVTSPTSHDAR